MTISLGVRLDIGVPVQLAELHGEKPRNLTFV